MAPWKLRVHRPHTDGEGTLDSWSIKVYGHESPPGASSLDSVTAGVGTLTARLERTPPTQEARKSPRMTCGTFQATSDEGVDSNWTVIEDVWNSESAGSLEYAITSLVGGVRYDIQVRGRQSCRSRPLVGVRDRNAYTGSFRRLRNRRRGGRSRQQSGTGVRLQRALGGPRCPRGERHAELVIERSHRENGRASRWTHPPGRVTGLNLHGRKPERRDTHRTGECFPN